MTDCNTQSTSLNNRISSRKRRVAYDSPSQDPRQSQHWQGLIHNDGDTLLNDLEEFKEAFQKDISAAACTNNDRGINAAGGAKILAVWSCVAGYCESLSTQKDPARRYCVFPIPLSALRRLVEDEFIPMLQKLPINDARATKTITATTTNTDANHRLAVRCVSNAIWACAPPKAHVRDEVHANSLYVCLRGRIDKKSLDCFSSALVTIAGLQILGFPSFLTLSEDHAYESHLKHDSTENDTARITKTSNMNNVNDSNENDVYATCEIAIPGNTKEAKEKRGKEISEHFRKQNNALTADTSWLYMRKHPIICETIPMTIAAAAGNINCTIDSKKAETLHSGQLFDLKREMLWILYDVGCLSKFPFGLIELGDCEENRPSERGNAWTNVPELGGNVLWNEKIFHEAISISKSCFGDAQTYPYFYAGHYHKDAGADNDKQEYRLVEALRMYAEASRVASQYIYDSKDSLQLMKHMTQVTSLIQDDILTVNGQPRQWKASENAIASGTWLLAFFDSLLHWEEVCETKFVDILTPGHKTGLKLFQLYSVHVRTAVLEKVFEKDHDDGAEFLKKSGDEVVSAITINNMMYFKRPRSKRLAKEGLLVKALQKPKIGIGDIEMALPGSDGGRRAKRSRRS